MAESLVAKIDRTARLEALQSKQLRQGGHVTVIGHSSRPGDALIVAITDDAMVSVACADGSSFTVTDPGLLALVPWDQRDENDVVNLDLLWFATDKYEAAVSLYHCECVEGVGCVCSPVASTRMELPATPFLPIRRSVQCFDEYVCAERLDRRRLRLLLDDLQRDKQRRLDCRARLEARIGSQDASAREKERWKQLLRCEVLELTAETIASLTEELQEDEHGCVVHEVKYQHRDPALRGRLYAIGQKIQLQDDKYPRTTTLQGMCKDLRLPLVGSFAHDVDCENSDVRLVCSLAEQLDLKAIVPTLLEYRDTRQSWIERIAAVWAVSTDAAKRLASVIVSGGRFEDWLCGKCGVPRSRAATAAQWEDGGRDQVRKFAFRLFSEIAALRDELLRHPRFAWTTLVHSKLQQEGKSQGEIKRLLMPRIIEVSENEVLSIVHRCFFDDGWSVTAKVFDGLIAWHNDPSKSLDVTMRRAEAACVARGWDVRLAEKPLYGMEDWELPTVEAARDALDDGGPRWRRQAAGKRPGTQQRSSTIVSTIKRGRLASGRAGLDTPSMAVQRPIAHTVTFDSGMIFGCRKGTQREVIERQLFGLPINHMESVQRVGENTALFLFNMSSRHITGVFQRAAPPGLNLVPDAWQSLPLPLHLQRKRGAPQGSPYPAQVPFKTAGAPYRECRPIPESVWGHLPTIKIEATEHQASTSCSACGNPLAACTL